MTFGLSWLPLVVGPHAKYRDVRQDAHGKREHPVKGVIVHSMGEYVQGVYAPDLLNTLKVSAHAFVTPDGSVLGGVPVDRVAYHAGKSLYRGEDWLNRTFLGVEVLVPGDHDYASFLKAIKTDCYTEEQYKATAYLVAGWCQRFGIPRDYIVGHRDVSGPEVRSDPKMDPGDGWDMARFWAAFGTA